MATWALCKDMTHSVDYEDEEVCCCKEKSCDLANMSDINAICKNGYKPDDTSSAWSTNASLSKLVVTSKVTKAVCEESGWTVAKADAEKEDSDTISCMTCASDRKYVASSDGGSCECKTWDAEGWDCLVNNQWTMWIELNPDCLTSWSCSLNVYELLGIRKSDQNPDPNLFVQDIVLWATSFIGIVVTISLVVAGAKYIFSAAPWNVASSETARNGILYAFLWLLLVSLSYGIIRIIQYIAAG